MAGQSILRLNARTDKSDRLTTYADHWMDISTNSRVATNLSQTSIELFHLRSINLLGKQHLEAVFRVLHVMKLPINNFVYKFLLFTAEELCGIQRQSLVVVAPERLLKHMALRREPSPVGPIFNSWASHRIMDTMTLTLNRLTVAFDAKSRKLILEMLTDKAYKIVPQKPSFYPLIELKSRSFRGLCPLDSVLPVYPPRASGPTTMTGKTPGASLPLFVSLSAFKIKSRKSFKGFKCWRQSSWVMRPEEVTNNREKETDRCNIH